MGGGRSLSVPRRPVQPTAASSIGARPGAGVTHSARVRSTLVEPLPTDILCLHLAGGTADESKLLSAAFGPPGHWRERSPDEWAAAGLPSGRVDLARPHWDGRTAEAERRECAARGVRLVWCGEDGFPARLRDPEKPPLVLSVLGRWPPPERALAVVGSRAATPYGLNATRRLAGAAARAGFGIVSGLARGIDRAAHEAALAEGAWPVAVLGNGLLVPYPPEHAALQSEIARCGTLLSEFPLRYPPSNWTFPRRNRLISALARHVLVVEAGEKSGALITVGFALAQERDVLVVPGPIDSSASRGTNRLLYDGAQPIIDVESLLMALKVDSVRAPAAPPPDDPLLAALGEQALPADELAQRLGRPVSEVRAALVALELAGRVRRLVGSRFAAR